MFDQNKRHTIKILGGVPLLAMPFFTSAGDIRIPADNDSNTMLSAATQYTGMPLQIQILDTTSVPDNNVILHNASDEPLLIRQFMPGHIYFKEQIMDLNEAIGKQPLNLQAGQSRVFEFKAWPVLSAGPVEYVWANHAIEKLSENTSIISLDAFIADTNAIVCANARQIMTS